MINHKYKCIFVEIPKNASTSVTEWLQENDSKYHKPEAPNRGEKWREDRAHRDGHLHTTELRHMYSKYWNDYYKFAIIRNPFDRAFSNYSHLIWWAARDAAVAHDGKTQPRQQDRSALHRRVIEEASGYKNFSDFCKGYLSRITLHDAFENRWKHKVEENMWFTVHMKPQSYWVSPAEEWADDINIIRYEALEEGINSVSDTLGIPLDERAAFPWEWKCGKKMGDHRDFYDEESIRIVKEKYKSDFYFFKYKF
jgi:hypothetical protein